MNKVIGTKIKNWTIVSFVKKDSKGRYWYICECSCGGRRQFNYKNLRRNGREKCVDCSNNERSTKEQFIGKELGNWKIIEEKSLQKYQRKIRYWIGECKCGSKREFNFYQITNFSKTTKRMPKDKCIQCLAKDRQETKKFLKIIPNFFWRRLFSDKRRKWKVEVTRLYLQKLFDKQNGLCALTKQPIYFCKSEYLRQFTTASLDRIDSLKGYIKGNVQWVHKDVNLIKQDYDQNYFIEICKKIAANN